MARKSWQLIFLILFSLSLAPVLARAFNVGSLAVGRRWDDMCAEHDNFLAHALQSMPVQTVKPAWVASYNFDIIATHPLTEAPANGLPPAQWCTANFTGCPTSNGVATTEIVATDIFKEVYNDGMWIISTLDVSGTMKLMDININGDNYGQHNGLVFNRRRTATAGTWPQFFVLYANGFIRLKPMGESDSSMDDPCFGTSAVLGPYQFAPPLLASAPHPELHPILDQANVSLSGPGKKPSLSAKGRFVDSSATTFMNATWLISTTRVDTSETRLNVQQQTRGIIELSLKNVSGNSVLGAASLSSMWVDADTHDADVLQLIDKTGQVHQIHASDITGTPFGETLPFSVNSPYTLSLVTTTATDHNVGAPDMHLYLKQASFYLPVYLPIVRKS
ncbi:MAG: hypothetical protein KDJ52_17925 [Anaerolineae bacterium]|nr:hypothetical protein [Anaerolineae bacterium]